jgi:hypothetical protein
MIAAASCPAFLRSQARCACEGGFHPARSSHDNDDPFVLLRGQFQTTHSAGRRRELVFLNAQPLEHRDK